MRKEYITCDLFQFDFLQTCQFDCNVSPGDFVSASRETSKKPGPDGMLEEEEKDAGVKKDPIILFSCPNEGCMKMNERRSSLEKHLTFGKCRMMAEKETLLDKAKKVYHTLLQEGISTAKELGAGAVKATECVSLSEGWALKTTRK